MKQKKYAPSVIGPRLPLVVLTPPGAAKFALSWAGSVSLRANLIQLSLFPLLQGLMAFLICAL